SPEHSHAENVRDRVRVPASVSIDTLTTHLMFSPSLPGLPTVFITSRSTRRFAGWRTANTRTPPSAPSTATPTRSANGCRFRSSILPSGEPSHDDKPDG